MKRDYYSDFFAIHTYWRNSSTNSYKDLWCQIEPFGLANWTTKVFSVSRRNIQYRARLKGPPFQFICIVRFFSKHFSPSCPPSILLMFDDRMDVEKSQRVLLVLSAIWDVFEKKTFSPKGLAFIFLIFWCFSKMDVKNPKGPLLLARQFAATFDFFRYSKRIFKAFSEP